MASVTLLVLPGTGMVDQDLAHHARAHCEEVSPILPLRIRPMDQPQVCFVHKGARLQRVVRALIRHLVPRQAFQFRKDDRNELL
jgi:hypothetical protein